jgi:hypothetical protein
MEKTHYYVSNFHVGELSKYEQAMRANPALKLSIRNDASDLGGKPLPAMLALYGERDQDLTKFWDVVCDRAVQGQAAVCGYVPHVKLPWWKVWWNRILWRISLSPPRIKVWAHKDDLIALANSMRVGDAALLSNSEAQTMCFILGGLGFRPDTGGLWDTDGCHRLDKARTLVFKFPPNDP